jgi:hypothetical protein
LGSTERWFEQATVIVDLEVKIRRPFWLVRAVIGATVVVSGIIILRTYSEGLGAAVILTGVVIGVRGTFGPIVTALFGILYVVLSVTYFYWMIPDDYDYGFNEWFSENWWMYAYSTVLIFGILASLYRQNADAWKALRASYSAVPETLSDKDSYSVRSGLLRVDEEFVHVHVIATRDGLLIAKENDGHIFFPWSRIREITISDSKPSSAHIQVDRVNMIPLQFDLPWDAELSKSVPSDVRLVDR